MKLYGIRYGVNFKYGTRASVFKNADRPHEPVKDFSFFCYLAEYEGKHILFDTGFSDEKLAEDMGVRLLPVRQEIRSVFGTVPNIDAIILTHSHWDHIENISLFPNSDIFLSQKTYDLALAKASEKTKARLQLPNVHIVDLPCRIYDKFELIHVGGHTQDSCAVLFEEKETSYAITGDECYLCENAEKEISIGITVSDEKNRDFIKRIKREKRTPLPFHDGELLNKYKSLSKNVIEIIA